MKALFGVAVTLSLGLYVLPLCNAQPDLPRIKAQPDFYRLRVRIADNFSQEIQVKARDQFSVSTTLESSRWTITGSNETTPANTQMVVRLDVQQEQKTPEGLFAVVNRAEPKVVVLIDGPESTMVITRANPKDEPKSFKIVVGVRPAPVKEK